MGKTIIIISIFITLGFFSNGQTIDSLEKRLGNADLKSIDRVEILNLLSRDLTFIDSKKSLEYANEALNIALKENNLIGIAYAYRNISSAYRHNEIYFLSIEYIQNAIDIFQNINDSVGIANCYISLGHIYRSLKNVDDEVLYHKKSFEIFTKLNIPERIGVAAHNLGESYLNAKEYDLCREFTQHAIEVNTSVNNLSVLSSCYKVIGLLELSLGNIDNAEKHFNRVLEISSLLGKNSQKIATVVALINLANIHKQKANTSLYLDYLKKASFFSHENALIAYLPSIYIDLISFYAIRKDAGNVHKLMGEYRMVLDSINNKVVEDRLGMVDGLMQANRTKKEMEVLSKVREAQEDTLRVRTYFLAVSIFSIFLLGLLVFNLQKANKKIKAKNQQLTEQKETIEKQKIHLEELNSTKNKFFGIVSHDLKSPLNSLKSFSTLLTVHIDSLSKEELNEMSVHLSSTLDNTIKMTDNLLEWAIVQMNEHKVNPELIPISDIVKNICEVYKQIANKKEISITCSFDDTQSVYGDKHQIIFAVRNLVNNAIKFTNTGGIVNLTAKLVSENRVRIEVADNGIGIAENDLKDIFSLSRKVSQRGTSGEKGTGLGLLLAQEFIRINNGEIEVESKVGQGSTFRVILPRGVVS